MDIRGLRERINLWIYDSKPRVIKTLSFLNALVSLMSIGVLIYYYGFPLTSSDKHFTFQLFQISFGFYVLRYLIRLFYDFDPVSFVKNNWFEGIVIGFLLVEGIAFNVFGSLLIEPLFISLGFENFADFSTIFVQLFVFAILLNNVLKQGTYKPWAKAHPALLFIIAILAITGIGTGLLMLPEMSTIEGSIPFTDSLFYSISSVSATGLSTLDVPTVLTFKGQVVMMVLIKVGGLNTIAFGALMLLVAKFGVGVKQHEIMEDFVNKDSLLQTNSMFAKIFMWSTGIELIGAILLFFGFGSQGVFADLGDRLFHSVFHSISAFNNAGYSILSGGLMHPDVVNNHAIQAVFTCLIFLGGFGMIYLFDLFELRRLRERMMYPWKTIEFGTKISLYFTLVFLILGAVVFFIFEYYNSLKHDSLLGDIVVSLFHSMSTRNAGFNSVDISTLTVPVMVIFLFLMFVGASSGSAGGGIRTSTFAIMWASVISVLRGKKNTELFKRTIANDVVLKAYAVFLFFIIGNIIGPLILTITEADLLATGRFDFMDLVFEHVSAASTVGLSTGVTPELSEAGKYVLIFAMFIGRVGTLTVAYLISQRVISSNYKYPEGHTMVG
jgi:Trk-type K+ transport system membrane component